MIVQMTTILTGASAPVVRDEARWLDTAEVLSALLTGRELGNDAANLIEDLMIHGQYSVVPL